MIDLILRCKRFCYYCGHTFWVNWIKKLLKCPFCWIKFDKNKIKKNDKINSAIKNILFIKNKFPSIYLFRKLNKQNKNDKSDYCWKNVVQINIFPKKNLNNLESICKKSVFNFSKNV